MDAMNRAIARRRLDQRLDEFPESLLATPPKGWIVAVRNALGMSVRELGERMGTSGQHVSRLERAETSGRIQLSTLERAAAALNCRVVYVLVPNEGSLEETVQNQARRNASAAVRSVAGTMELENQTVPAHLASEQIERLAEKLVDRRGLWASRGD